MLVKTDAAIFEVNMTNHSQDSTKKQFRRQLKESSHKQSLLWNRFIEKKYFTFFLRET